MAKSELIGSVDRRFTVKENSVEGILSYGKDNGYAQRVSYSIAASATATACVRRYAKHIFGRGFLDDVFSKTKVNYNGITINELAAKCGLDYAIFGGFTIHINFNLKGDAIEFQHVPFQNARICIPDSYGYVSKIAIYDNWFKEKSRNITIKNIDKIHVFNPDPEIIKHQIEMAGGIEKYLGQVLYFTPNGIEYPTSPCDPVMTDMEADEQISIYNWRTVKTGFIQQTVYTQVGEFEKEEERRRFVEHLKGLQGSENSNQILFNEVKRLEDAPIISSIPVTINDKLFESMQKTVTEKIIRNYGIPLCLVSVQQPGSLGLSKEFEEAESNYDNMTVDERINLEMVFKKLFSVWGNKINVEQIKLIPKGGIKPDSEKQPLASLLGVGGIQALQAIMVDATLSTQQKINSLVFVFGIPQKEAEALINGTILND